MPRISFVKTCLAFFVVVSTTLGASARDLRLEEFFLGHTTAVGKFTTITGFERGFKLNLFGRFNGKTLTLREDFIYDDGERERKTWRFTITGKNTYSGIREDMLAPTTVTVDGDTATFNYRLNLEPEGRNIVRLYDTMVLSADGKSLLNTAKVFKGPLRVGSVRVDFER
ncbi:MAG: DUF3833 family protein [Pseudomonadota bacterium]